MCPSTCASSVVSRLRKYSNNPTIAASTTAPPAMISRLTLGFANPFGVSASNRSSVIRGAFAAFSKPTSISMLIVPPLLLCVNLFHLPSGACLIRPRQIEELQRRNLVDVRARQRVQGLKHFAVVRHGCFEE